MEQLILQFTLAWSLYLEHVKLFLFQYGLYSAFMGCFMYVIFGSCKDITVGPTAIMSLLTAEYASKDPVFVILLTFLTGLIILLLGLLRLGEFELQTFTIL